MKITKEQIESLISQTEKITATLKEMLFSGSFQEVRRFVYKSDTTKIADDCKYAELIGDDIWIVNEDGSRYKDSMWNKSYAERFVKDGLWREIPVEDDPVIKKPKVRKFKTVAGYYGYLFFEYKNGETYGVYKNYRRKHLKNIKLDDIEDLIRQKLWVEI